MARKQIALFISVTDSHNEVETMSWDIIVQDIPAEARSLSDIPDDFEPGIIGSRTGIIAAIQSVSPATDFSDPAWGVLDNADGGYRIEFNMGDEEELHSFAMHVRGSHAVVPVISAVLDAAGCRAFDMSAGDIFNQSAAYESLKSFNAYKNQITGG